MHTFNKLLYPWLNYPKNLPYKMLIHVKFKNIFQKYFVTGTACPGIPSLLAETMLLVTMPWHWLPAPGSNPVGWHTLGSLTTMLLVTMPWHWLLLSRSLPCWLTDTGSSLTTNAAGAKPWHWLPGSPAFWLRYTGVIDHNAASDKLTSHWHWLPVPGSNPVGW